jgi:hypothetical protein
MAECGHGSLADGEAVLREQFGNHFFGRGQFLETLWPARRELRGRLPD